MKWINLKQNKCPSCDKIFGVSSFSKKLGYIVCPCGYIISNKRFSEIVNSQVNQALEDKWNQEIEEDNL